MSHVVDIKVRIDDLSCLEEAARRLGLELVRGQTQFRWYGRHVGDYPMPEGFVVEDMGKCEHAIRIPGDEKAYEIGVVKSRTGPGYTLLYDHWAGGCGMSKVAGDRCQKLAQAYAVARVRKAVRRTHRIQEQVLPNGSIKLSLTAS